MTRHPFIVSSASECVVCQQTPQHINHYADDDFRQPLPRGGVTSSEQALREALEDMSDVEVCALCREITQYGAMLLSQSDRAKLVRAALRATLAAERLHQERKKV